MVREGYGDAFLTAHFEVPGEMFSLAMQAKKRDRGVVGSTSNILDFIAGKVCVCVCVCVLDGEDMLTRQKDRV